MNAGSAGQPLDADPTTQAICGIAETMDSEAYAIPPACDLPGGTSSYRTNHDAEISLIGQDVFVKRGAVQRSVLGCMACRLGGNQENAGLTAPQVAACAGREPMSVRRVFKRLVDAGILELRTTDTTGGALRAAAYDFTGGDGAIDLKGRLQKPAQCGLEAPRNILNTEAERVLVEENILGNRTDATRTILGCLACRWQAGTGVHGLGVEQCNGVNNTTAGSLLRKLAQAGVVTSRIQERNTVGRMRVCYTPAATDLGRRIAWLLEMPSSCGLDTQNGKEDK